MDNKIIIKTFKTRQNNYVYDRYTNSVFLIDDDDFIKLKMLEQGKVSEEISEVISKYQCFGLLGENNVKKIEHPATNLIEHMLENRMEHLILQVTQRCNLRCSYCTYSGIYDSTQRVHSNKDMNFETAKQAIDFFLKHSRERNQIHIAFYGGEPLLRFDLIKQCVDYALNNCEGKDITFGMTTNGTLLKGDIADYLNEHGFQVGISLDGNKEEHDANRVFVNGKGSFDVIMENVRNLKKRNNDLYKSISFMATMNPKADIACIVEYYKTDELFNDRSIMFSEVKETGIIEDLHYNKKYHLVRKYEYLKVLFMLAGLLDRKYTSQLAITAYSTYKRFYNNLKSHNPTKEVMHHGGPCLVGVARLFVSADGVFYPCERVPENVDYFKIGSLKDGIDLEQAKKIINNGKITENQCVSCWNLRNCSICSSNIVYGNYIKPCLEAKITACEHEKARVMGDLYELCVLREFGYNAEE